MLNDYMKATGGEPDLEFEKTVIYNSASILDWMMDHGVRFQHAITGTLHLSRTNAWFLGGGKAMMNSLYRSAENLGVHIRYNAEVIGLDVQDGHFRGAGEAVHAGGFGRCWGPRAVRPGGCNPTGPANGGMRR